MISVLAGIRYRCTLFVLVYSSLPLHGILGLLNQSGPPLDAYLIFLGAFGLLFVLAVFHRYSPQIRCDIYRVVRALMGRIVLGFLSRWCLSSHSYRPTSVLRSFGSR
ncbi:hypothetical protein AG1IA_10062 [Rhizoctonia solani AG-1 IA]|uniref:Uncharacterized protein n=1 Tax=Thanatephorus cucumeris (strain AG1-IA) TaxID=983506 RepID=L8WGK0_THACA|nr:hypothetical protein AG1IA_10062 [Rhizoctonia solani AG-1 IA]